MKKTPVLILITLAVLLLCLSLSGCGGVAGNGQMTSRDIPLPDSFKGAKTMTSIDIIVDASLQGKAVLEGESNILDAVQVNDEDGLLAVSYKPGALVLPGKPVKLRIPYFEGGVLETSSSGNISMNGSDALKGDTFNLRVNSTGSIHVKIEAKEVNARSSGNGSITIAGSAEKAFIELSSTGSFHGFDFALQNARVQLSSLGNAEVNVSGELSGNTSSLGGITYDGEPAKISVEGGKVNKR